MTKYDKLVNHFLDKGFSVKENTFIEAVGYDKPTEEYSFSVKIKKSKKKVVELFYSFKDNKDVIDYVQMWETKLELVEKEQKQIF
jgi:K+ transporter